MSFQLRNRSIVLIAAEVLLIFTSAFWDGSPEGNKVVILLYTTFLCLGGYVMSQSIRWLKAYIFLVLGSMFFGMFDLGYTSLVLRLVFNSAAYLLLFRVILRYSFFQEHVAKADRILAGVAGYLLLGLFWASFFMLMGTSDPGSIFNQVSGEATTRAEELYYSYVTITSLGYGDIVPVSPIAKVVATFAGLSGVLYTAIFISALISSLKSKE
ncbi:potassium channel family protein [Rubritalea sp.]|uniref:potassium channel family protein n=1 Tax=Rubritalea sp. TaxID=2109375 RepID=UPI003EF9975E